MQAFSEILQLQILLGSSVTGARGFGVIYFIYDVFWKLGQLLFVQPSFILLSSPIIFVVNVGSCYLMLFIVRVIIDITRPGPSVCHITYQNVFEWVRKHELIFGNPNIDVDLLIVQQQRREWWLKWFFIIHFWNTEIIKISFGGI